MAGKKESLSKESKITILSLLKNFYDNEVFLSLIREIYSSDLSISLAAIEASASLGNEIAIPHLYKIIEKGRPEQTCTGIKALAEIKAPSTIPRLLEYYNIFRKTEIQLEILTSLNTIDTRHEKIIELNKQVLQNSTSEEALKVCAAKALVESEEFRFLQIHLSTTSQKVLEAVFLKVLESKSEKVPGFLWYFRDDAAHFPPSTLGCYIAAYQASAKHPQQSYVIEKLKGSDRRTMISFLLSIEKYGNCIIQPLQVFRTLLIMPYMNKKTEAVTGDSIEKLILNVRETSGFLLNEMAMITRTHLDSILVKVKQNYLSRGNNGDKEILLMTIFAHLLENYGSQKIISEVKLYFKSNYVNRPVVSAIVANIKKQFAATGAGKEEKKILEACFPLFEIEDTTARLKMLSCLKNINLHRPLLLKRLNRLIRVTGVLSIRTSVKKVLEVLDFARQEHIPFLEETAIVTLCQLLHHGTIEQAHHYLQYPDTPSFRGYIRGARYMKPDFIIQSLLDLLSRPILNIRHREIIISSILEMDHKEIRNVMSRLLHIIGMNQIPALLKEKLGNLIILNSMPSLFQPLLDLTYHQNELVRCIAVKAIKEVAKTNEKIPIDLFINRLYILLDDGSKTLKNEVLLTLINLEDDYSIQLLKDDVMENDEQVAAGIIERIEVPLSHDIVTFLLSLVWEKSGIMQKALRTVISKLVSGDYAEEIRNTLLEYLKPGLEAPVSAAGKATGKDKDEIITHAKREYKFKHENSQLVTVFFIDMAGYTEKSSDADSLSLMNLIRDFEEVVIPVINEYQGIIIKKMGDGILAIFKNPLNACFSALTIQDMIKEKNTFTVEKEKFEVRIGLNTGEVIRKEGDVYGDVVNVASRMETAANPGDILLTQSTYDEIKEYIKCTRLGNIIVKGKKETITAYTAEKVMTDTNHILKKNANQLYKYTDTANKNPLTVLKESIFTPDFSLPPSYKENRDLLQLVSSMLEEITNLGREITHDYYDEYMFKRYIQEKWDKLLDSLKHKEIEANRKSTGKNIF